MRPRTPLLVCATGTATTPGTRIACTAMNQAIYVLPQYIVPQEYLELWLQATPNPRAEIRSVGRTHISYDYVVLPGLIATNHTQRAVNDPRDPTAAPVVGSAVLLVAWSSLGHVLGRGRACLRCVGACLPPC